MFPPQAQLWRTLRTFGTVFVVLSGVGALLEQTGSGGAGGVARGLMGGSAPGPQPSIESSTTFADVKVCCVRDVTQYCSIWVRYRL